MAVSESPKLEAVPTVSAAEDEIAPKLPAAGAVAVMVSVPTGSAVVVVVAMQEVGFPAGAPVKVAVPSVVPPVANVSVAVGQAPSIGETVSVRVTAMPKVSPVAGETVNVPEPLAGVTVSVAIAEPEA